MYNNRNGQWPLLFSTSVHGKDMIAKQLEQTITFSFDNFKKIKVLKFNYINHSQNRIL